MLQWLIKVRLGSLDIVNWSIQGIHALSPSLGACTSLARDARVGAGMSCHGRAHESTCLLWPAVLAVGPLCISEVFMCMSYDWGLLSLFICIEVQLCSKSNL